MTNLGNLGNGLWALLSILNILRDGDQEDQDNREKIISLGAKAIIKWLENFINPPADDTTPQ